MPNVGLNSQPGNQELRALLTEPARLLYLYFICIYLSSISCSWNASFSMMPQSPGSQWIFVEWMSMSFVALTSASTTVNKTDTHKSHSKVCMSFCQRVSKQGVRTTLKRSPCSEPSWSQSSSSSPLGETLKLTSYFFSSLRNQDTSLFSIPPLPQQTPWWQESTVGVIKPGARIRILAASLPYRETWQVHWHLDASVSLTVE